MAAISEELDVAVEPATADRFDDVCRILAPSNPDTPACWCLSYRLSSGESNRLTAAERPEALRALCERDVAPGVIGYVAGEPAGWCAFGPRSEMGRLVRSRTILPIDDKPVWSVVCFVVRAPYRRRGLARKMLLGAVAYAVENGAQTLEAYPVDTEGGRVSSTFAYVGTTSLFESVGFHRAGRTTARSAGLERQVMRLEVTAAPVAEPGQPYTHRS